MLRSVFGAALLAVGFASASPAAAEMRFRWVEFGSPAECGRDCPRVIEARGPITTDTPRAFVEFLARDGDVPGTRRVVLLHSPGGVLRAGMQLGMIFRRMQMTVFVGRFVDTRTLQEAGALNAVEARRSARRGSAADRPVSGACVSACVYAFLGGTTRIVPSSSRIGVHRPFRAPANTDASPADLSAMVAWDRGTVQEIQRRYISSMGADPGLVALEQTTASTSIRFLTSQDMRRLRIVTRAR